MRRERAGQQRAHHPSRVGWLEGMLGARRNSEARAFGLCDYLQEPRQCEEVTEDGEPNAIPVELGVGSALPACGVALGSPPRPGTRCHLLPGRRWRRSCGARLRLRTGGCWRSRGSVELTFVRMHPRVSLLPRLVSWHLSLRARWRSSWA